MQIKKTINEKTYVYDEKFFSGKKSLTINGKQLQWVGLFCGAIGCMLSVLFSLLCAAINATICRSEKIRSAIVKVIIGIVTSAISTSAWFGIYWLIVQAILK